jgi:hypothetical protein
MPARPDPDINAMITLVEGLKNEVGTMVMKCAQLEGDIRDLKSKCGTHERFLESHRLEIIGLKNAWGNLDANFQGESYDIK